MKKRFIWLWGVSVTAALSIACTAVPTILGTSRSNDVIDASSTNSPIFAAFNNTYGERIDLNRPKAQADPNNSDKNLIRLIKGAKKSIDGSFYDIEAKNVVDEIIAAKKRGVLVRLVTDNDNLVEKSDPTKPREAIVSLQEAGVPIVDDQRSAIMHDKFMIVDQSVVWTGSTNLTPTSLYCHNNNALTIRSEKLADVFTDEFERLFVKKQFGKSSRGIFSFTPNVKVGEAQIRVFFSPGGGGRDAVVSELKKAKKSIRFLTFSLTDVETGDVMLAKAEAGVKVEGIFDRWLAAGEYSLYKKFKEAGLSVLKDGNEALMHHKVIIVDDSTLISGSYNYSENAENNNNEAFLIIHQAPSLTAAYKREFDRIAYAAVHNHPPFVKRDDAEKKSGEQK